MLVWCIACSSLQLLGFNLSDLCLSFGYLFYCINHYFCCSFKFFYWTLVCVSVWMQASLPISDVIQQNYAFSWCWVVKWVWYLCWFILLFMYVCRVILSILTVNMACNIILSESAFLNQLDAALVLLQGWYTFTCTNCCCVITCYSYLFLNLPCFVCNNHYQPTIFFLSATSRNRACSFSFPTWVFLLLVFAGLCVSCECNLKFSFRDHLRLRERNNNIT